MPDKILALLRIIEEVKRNNLTAVLCFINSKKAFDRHRWSGLMLNTKKTEVVTYNIPQEHPPPTTIGGTALKEVKDFKKLGGWVNSTAIYVALRYMYSAVQKV